MNKRGEELQTQDRLLCECRQQIIVLEGEQEQSAESLHRLQCSVDDYMQKYQQSVEHISGLESSLRHTQDNLDDAKNKVRAAVAVLEQILGR